MKTKQEPKTAQDIANESGYPLQIYLENQINDTKGRHGWKGLVREHRWINPRTEEENFIDLVLENVSHKLRLVIECKRIIGSWTFLLPGQDLSPVWRVRTLHSQFEAAPSFAWEEIGLVPKSYESAFCVTDTEGKKDNRTLENWSGGLLLS